MISIASLVIVALANTYLPAYATDLNVHEWLDGDYAYISELSIEGKSTGAAPFDDNDDPGNDSSASNDIIRSFDTATYSVKFVTTSYDDQDYYKNARVGFRFILDQTDEDIVRFDLDSMLWVDTESGYKPLISQEAIDGKNCTVLTCWRRLETTSSVPNVVPSTNTVNVVIETKAATNGTQINLDVESWCEYNETDGECDDHGKDEVATLSVPTLMVSAVPRYNVQLKEVRSQIVGYGDYDFDDDSLVYGDEPMNYGAGIVNGRLYAYGITLQLYNTDPEKRLKGIELPTGPITFQLGIKSELKVYGEDEVDVTDDYLPLVWSFGENNTGTPVDANARKVDINGQDYTYAVSSAPFNRRVNGDGEEEHRWFSTCYDGGTWYGEQDDDTIYVTVDDYDIDIDTFPYVNAGSTGESHDYYAGDEVQNIGCFSAGELFIIQPFTNMDTGETFFDEFDCENGDFTITITDSHLKAESVSGQETYDDGIANQTNQDDDEAAMTKSAYIDTKYSARIVYSYADNESGKSEGTDELDYTHNYSDGTDAALPGAELRIMGGYEVETFQHENDVVASDMLVKFDDKAIEYDPSRNTGIRGSNTSPDRVLFAAKRDGTGWVDDDEQISMAWDELVYYNDYQNLLDDGATCVGLMYETRELQDEITEHDIRASFPVKVRDDAEIRHVAMTTGVNLIWQRYQIDDAVSEYFDKDVTDLGKDDYDEYLASEFPSVADGIDIDPSIVLNNGRHYEKTIYDDDGLVHDHSGTNQYGDSLLILGEKMIIDKHVAQEADGDHKEIFDIDYAQRYVDYVIEPAFDTDEKPDAEGDYTTTVTVTDTIPEDLTYVPGSSYVGGTYAETNGGQGPGVITGGTEIEPNASRNDVGLVELEWVFEDVPYGAELDDIHFTCLIGTPGDSEHDVQNNDQIINNVEIRSTNDIRDIRPEYMNTTGCTIRISKNMSQSLAIRPTPIINELDSEVSFISTLGNYSATSKDEVGIYLLPYDGDGMSNFSGDYDVTGISIVDNGDVSGLTFYVTDDTSVRGRELRDIERDEIEDDWIECSINPSTGEVKLPDGIGTITAWCVIDDDMVSDERIDVTTLLLPNGNETGDAYGSSLCDGDNVVTATLYVVGRTVSGHVFIDANENDAYDEGEQLFENATVRLVDGGGDIVKALDGTPCEIATDEDGYYEFTSVPEGDFDIVFSPADGENWEHLSAVAVDAADDDVDSDAEPTMVDGKLTGAVIDGIEMPVLEDIVGDGYSSEHNDLGLRIEGAADIDIVKNATVKHQESCTDKGDTAHVGDIIEYKATITNTGDVTLTDIWVDDNKLGIDGKVVSDGLAAGDSVEVSLGTYTVVDGDVVSGIVTNDVTTNGNPPRYVTPPDDASDDVETPVEGNAALDIVKSTTVTHIENPKVGDVIPYVITITNIGDVTITDITATDALSDIGELTLDKTTLTAGESVTVNAEHKLTQADIDAGQVINTVSTKGKFGDDEPSDDSDEVITTLEQTPDISLVKSTENTSLDAEHSVIGQVIGYDFLITNTGNVTLHDVDLIDHLNGVYDLSVDWNGSSDDATDEGVLSVGETVKATAKYKLTQSDIDAGKVVNTATTTGLSPKDEQVDDDSSAETVLAGTPAIKLEKSTDVANIDAEHAVVGARIPYAFTITNTGSVTLHDVTLTDQMLSEAGIAVDIDWDGSSDAATGVGVLSPSETVSGTATYAITDADIKNGKVVNEATVTGTPDNGEPVSDNDDATTAIEQAAPHLTLMKTSDVKLISGDDAVAGTVVSWTISVTNDGNARIDDIAIDDKLTGAKVITDGFDGTLDVGESVELKVEYALTDKDIDGSDVTTKTVPNTASAHGTYHGDKTIQSNEDTDTVDIRRNPSIELEKTVDITRIEDDDVKVGKLLTYTFVVRNTGDMTVNATHIIDSIDGLNVTIVDSPNGNDDATLPPDSEMTFTAQYAITQADIDAGKVINTAHAAGELIDGTPIESNTDDAVTDIVTSQHISIEKSVDIKQIDDPHVGDILTYSFTITNDGDTTLENVGINDDKNGLSDVTIDWSTSSDDVTANSVLSPNETVNATATYAITQEDIDAGEVMNVATSYGDTVNVGKHVESVPDDAVTVISTKPHISIVKDVDIKRIDDAKAGDVLTYSFTVKNDGNVTLTDIGIDDDLAGISELVFDWASSTDASTADGTLSPNESVTATATYAITQAGIDNGAVLNTATSYGYHDTTHVVSDPDTVETVLNAKVDVPVDTDDDDSDDVPVKVDEPKKDDDIPSNTNTNVDNLTDQPSDVIDDNLVRTDDKSPIVSTGVSSNALITIGVMVSAVVAGIIVARKIK